MTRDPHIAVVVGTRPEIIKMAEIVSLLGEQAALVHTGQHWHHEMSGTFMEGFLLPEPAASLDIGGGSRAAQIGRAIEALHGVFTELGIDAVVVQGDTNTALAAALAANAGELPLVHVEAGLRSYDRRMPEEHNRVLIDHLGDLLLAPTELNRSNLLEERIDPLAIQVTGNPVIAAVERAIHAGAPAAAALMDRLALLPGDYLAATIHRPENTDDPERLKAVLEALGELTADGPVVLALHPRTRARVVEFGLEGSLVPLTVVDPLGYEDFVGLCSNAGVTISDSGGVQEEASVWKRPVVVVRRSTERPEVQGTFAHLTDVGPPLVATARQLYADRQRIAAELGSLPSPYGGIDAAPRCVDAIRALLDHERAVAD